MRRQHRKVRVRRKIQVTEEHVRKEKTETVSIENNVQTKFRYISERW